ncbi:MAG TPA: hypothetical protein VKX17_24040 [Planctomycetota bacterium]|nr:hypothetical protein [Planctomycetota bacterium]
MRVRFSLATLVLVVLLIAAAATFWWNWEQWQPFASGKIPGTNFKFEYALDGSCFCAETGESAGDAHRVENTVTFFDADGTPLPGPFKFFWKDYITNEGFSRDGSLYFVNADRSFLWDVRRGIELLQRSRPANDQFISALAPNGSAALVSNRSGESALLRVPDLQFLGQWKRRPVEFSEQQAQCHDCFFIPEYDWGPGIINAVRAYGFDGSKRALFTTQFSLGPVSFSSDEALLIIPETRGNFRQQGVHDAKTGERLKTIKVNMEFESISSDNDKVLYRDGKYKYHLFNADGSNDRVLQAVNDSHCRFSDDLIPCREPLRVTSLRTGETVYDFDAEGYKRCWNRPSDSRLAFSKDEKSSVIHLFDCAADQSLGAIPRFRWREQLGDGLVEILFRPASNEFLSHIRNTSGDSYTLWRQTMPTKWLGALTMPEFWIMLILSVALIWTVVRNRRTRSRLTPHPLVLK